VGAGVSLGVMIGVKAKEVSDAETLTAWAVSAMTVGRYSGG